MPGEVFTVLAGKKIEIEIDAMLNEVLTRMTDFELAAPPEWLPSNFISGPKAMPLRFTATR